MTLLAAGLNCPPHTGVSARTHSPFWGRSAALFLLSWHPASENIAGPTPPWAKFGYGPCGAVPSTLYPPALR